MPFDRPRLLIVSRHAAIAQSIQQLIRLLAPSDQLPAHIEIAPFVVADDIFEQLDSYPPQHLLDLMVIVDITYENSPWSIAADTTRLGLATELALSYPEVNFVFLGQAPSPLDTRSHDRTECHLGRISRWAVNQPLRSRAIQALYESGHVVAWDSALRLLYLLKLHSGGFRPLLDPTRMRSVIKMALQRNSKRPSCFVSYSCGRLALSAAVADEEEDFLYLNGFAAFKAGHAVWLLSTYGEFRRVVDRMVTEGSKDPLNVILLDLDLTYADMPGSESAESLLQMTKQLQEVEVLVVSSYATDRSLAQVRCERRDLVVAPKPYGGIFGLYREDVESQIDRGKSLRKPNRLNAAFMELGSASSSPCAVCSTANSQTDRSRHSAPYAITRVAMRLMRRAKRCLSPPRLETRDAIQAATLALEAKEILGSLSRTLSLEALSLQNEAEVIAELTCFGTSAESDVRRRFARLREDAAAIFGAGKSARGQWKG
jgi:hypothetical protein